MKLAAVVAVVVWATAAAAFDRFFVMGDGRLSLVNAHTDARVDVRYRRADGTYDEGAIGAIRRAFRSEGDNSEGKASLRLIEILSKLQKDTGVRPLTLMSGYRSPTYNEALRASGARAAGGSLHTEGLAADVAFPRKLLKPLWMKVRAMDCCGAGYYAKEGFLHIDVGRPRFWEPATSRVEENLSAGNALVFARTEYDRYRVGERISIAIHAVTVPPVLLAEVAETEPATKATLRLAPPARRPDRCVAVDETGANVELDGELPSGRRRLLLKTCDAEPQNAPRLVATNAFEVR